MGDAPGARNGHHVRPLGQQPGQGDLRGRAALALRQCRYGAHQGLVGVDVAGLKAWQAGAEIALLEGRAAMKAPREKAAPQRSEERRVGKEGRSRWSPD